ncbi:hypothetical protein KKC47_04390, partial [Patescibacteria group bacterium]|nr:hypothetical protein [Patescibacteria group bacterium]
DSTLSTFGNWNAATVQNLKYEDQDIDISGGDTLKICDARTEKWVDSPTNFSNVEEREIFGITVPVITRGDLIDYKSMLIGEHQLVDIEAIRRCSPQIQE